MHKEELNEVVKQLRKKGVRITPQRVAMLEFLASVHTHPTAEEIFKALTKEDPQVSVATVYNNLNLFIKEGVVKELTYGDSASRYDFDLGQHYHAVCDVCGKVVDLYYPVLEDVEKAAEQLTGFKVRGHRMEVYGVCPECQKKNSNRLRGIGEWRRSFNEEPRAAKMNTQKRKINILKLRKNWKKQK